MKKYQAILFDVDGTLLDTSEGIFKSVLYTVEQMGLVKPDESEKSRFIGPPIQRSLKERYHLSEEDTQKAAKLFRDRYSTVDLDKAQVYDGIFALFRFLIERQVKIGVATYKRQDYADKIMDIFELSPMCDEIVGADFEGKYTKTDIIRICCERMGCLAENALMIGDTDSDLIGAKEAKLDFLPVTYGFGFSEKDNLTLAAHTPEDIIHFLEDKV